MNIFLGGCSCFQCKTFEIYVFFNGFFDLVSDVSKQRISKKSRQVPELHSYDDIFWHFPIRIHHELSYVKIPLPKRNSKSSWK